MQQTAQNPAEVPKWIEQRVLPATEERVKSLHLLKEGGLRASALLFTEEHAYVAEKGTLTGVKLYEVDYPEGLLINASECPHCGHALREPVRKIATVKGGRAAASTNGGASKAPATQMTRTIYAGKETPVEEIEGIGKTFVERLNKEGITTTDQLLAADAARVAQISQAPQKTVDKWIAMAELMRVNGIGKQFAELLVRSGVMSIDDLKNQKAADLSTLVNKTMESVDVTIQGAGVSDKRAANWIKAARKMRRTKSVTAPA